MCGILGFFGEKKPNLDFFNEILAITNHRGPDDSWIFSDEKIILGSNRLSILDLSSKGKPTGSIICRLNPVLEHKRIIFPVFGGIWGLYNTILIIKKFFKYEIK